ncbi:MAG: hypothetical protein ACYTAO_16285 [Planctomycetota bacterium]|jgi:hypothetical protein
MDTTLAVTPIVTVLLAFVGYLMTYLINLRTSQRKEQLERVSRQLKELYGPLLALTQASEQAWFGFMQKVGEKFDTHEGQPFAEGETPSREKVRE